MEEDGAFGLDPLLEHVPLDHLLNGEVATKFNDIGKGEFVQPLGVKFHLSGIVAVKVENFTSLVFVGLSVLKDFFFGKFGRRLICR